MKNTSFLLSMLALILAFTAGGCDIGGDDGDAPCQISADCGGNGVCDQTSGKCVDCLTSENCPKGRVCNQDTRTCVACLEDEDCGTGVCDLAKQFCVECMQDHDCASGTCIEEKQICLECVTAKDCAEPAPCFYATCLDSQCEELPLADGVPCDDGDLCTGFDSCRDGVCEGEPGVIQNCTPDEACNDKENGDPCDDGDPCTLDDFCAKGSCIGDSVDPLCSETDKDHDGFLASEGDCNDQDPMINPEAEEICNNLDDNCDGAIDEIGCVPGCIVSGCSDEICAEQEMVSDCIWLPEYECLAKTACGRLDSGACGWLPNPDFLECMESICVPGPEICNGLDDDCDGVADEDGACFQTCGGFMGQGCDEGQFCLFGGLSCGAADQLGVCWQIPEGCDQNYAPVCGCDNVTYSNECTAYMNGVSISSNSPCGSTCIGAGGTGWSEENDVCCEGLAMMPALYEDEEDGDGACWGPTCECFICAPCGDGTCDSSFGENKCSCPSDCGGPCPLDDDCDGVLDTDDNCPLTPNPDQLDSDQDGYGNVCDADDDNDGLFDTDDNCVLIPNEAQENHDGDSLGDACDLDDDNDGIPDTMDACPLDPTQGCGECIPAGQSGVGFSQYTCCAGLMMIELAEVVENDNDSLDFQCLLFPDCECFVCAPCGNGTCEPGLGENFCNCEADCPSACPGDLDCDGIADAIDDCPLVPNEVQLDTDGDGLGDACDLDDDNDGIPDSMDSCPLVPSTSSVDQDQDGVGPECDNCLLVPNPDQADSDGDGLGNACDSDSWTCVPEFGQDAENLGCCEGMTPVTLTTPVTYQDSTGWWIECMPQPGIPESGPVCLACGDGACGLYENPCTCPEDCGDPAPGCRSVNPGDFGVCEALIGWANTGNHCELLSGCGCDDQCDRFFPTLAECEAACFLD